MKILFLTQVLPYPLDAGPKLRAYYVLRHLAQQHEITLLSFVRSSDTLAAIAHLQEFCQKVHTVLMPRSKMRDLYHLGSSLLTREPFIIARDWLPEMQRRLEKIISEAGPFDVIHADQLWMAPYALWARRCSPPDQPPKLVLDQHNAVFMIPQRLAESDANWIKRQLLNLETQKLAQWEVATCTQFDEVVWVTQEDYAAVQHQAEQQGKSAPNSAIIPICGDLADKKVVQQKGGRRRVTFVGGLHYPPNAQGILWFATNVFPQVLVQAPDIVLTVIGKQPPEALHTLNIPQANLDVTGFVQELEPYLAETAVFVVPLQAGGGMRVKILDAWAWGLPIVSTTIGAEGIHHTADQNILIADSPETFAQATLRLLQEPQLGERMAQAGRAWVHQHYNWQSAYTAWDKIYPSSLMG